MTPEPSPFLTTTELPSALRGARVMSTAAEGALQIMHGAQAAKDAEAEKRGFLFLFNLPWLIFFFSISARGKIPTGSQTH